VVIVALLTILLDFGCAPERPPGPPSGNIIVAAGDIANCAGEGDEATAKLVEGIDGAAVLTLGDNAYPEGGPRTSSNATSRPGDSSRSAPDPSPETTSTKPKGPQPTSTTSVMPPETPMRATSPTTLAPGI
jgi:hypothetical protein